MAQNVVVDRDLGWRELLRRADALRGSAYCKVGVLGDSARGGMHEVGPDGKASPLTVAEIAAVNEFGTEDGRIPERSFVRSTFDEMKDELARDARALVVRVVLDGAMSAETALNLLGLKLATAIRRKITEGSGVAPRNAPSTMLRKAMKGRTGRFFEKAASTLGGALAQVGSLAAVRPLVDTGRLVGAISWAVVFDGRQQKENYVGGERK